MVYCPKCGTNNAEDATFCVKCGAALYPETRRERRGDTCFGPRREGRVEEECFGIPHGGAIVGIIFGAIIIFLGLAIASGQDVGRWIGPLFLVIIGVLIIVGAIYGFRRRYGS